MELVRTRNAFRLDINGMRALAVLGVIAFHFKLGPMRAGGFAGVDVFFVISGFLMTQIILSRLGRDAFSLGDFIMARARRIVPAFIVLVVSVLLAVLLFLNPLQLEAQGERGAWSLLFLSNFLYAKQGTYFISPEQNWLLHTWSLSVEWQFYLIFPVLLVVLRKLAARRSIEIGALGAVALASILAMAWSLSAGGESGTWNFYMLSSRAWEFLAGAFVAYAQPRVLLDATSRATLHYAGMAAILLAMMVFHNTTPWPSGWTLVPVAGAAAMLMARHESPAWAGITAVRLTGLWSYSIYLWHWPVAAALAFFDLSSLAARLLGVAASLLLGALSYLLVEQRLTDALWHARPRLLWAGLPAFGAALAFAVISCQSVGFEALRYGSDPALLMRLRDFRTAHSDWFSVNHCDLSRVATGIADECRYGNPKSDDVLVIGDSFAAQLAPRYQDVYRSAPFGISFVTHHSCIPITGTNFIEFNEPCDRWVDDVYRYAVAKPYKRVVFTAFWPRYDQEHLCIKSLPDCGTGLKPKSYDAALDEAYTRLAALWRKLREQGKDVVVLDVLPYPGDDGDPMRLYDKVAARSMLNTLMMSRALFAKQHAEATRRVKMAADLAGITYVDPAVSLCAGGECPIVVDGRPLYKDAYHLRNSIMKDARFAFLDRYLVPEGPRQARLN